MAEYSKKFYNRVRKTLLSRYSGDIPDGFKNETLVISIIDNTMNALTNEKIYFIIGRFEKSLPYEIIGEVFDVNSNYVATIINTFVSDVANELENTGKDTKELNSF